MKKQSKTSYVGFRVEEEIDKQFDKVTSDLSTAEHPKKRADLLRLFMRAITKDPFFVYRSLLVALGKFDEEWHLKIKAEKEWLDESWAIHKPELIQEVKKQLYSETLADLKEQLREDMRKELGDGK